jgi:hypothetical protein
MVTVSLAAIRSFTRTAAVAATCFLLGILFLTDNLLLPQGNYIVLVVSLSIGVQVPLFIGITRKVAGWALVVASGLAALATILLINGIEFALATAVLLASLPCVLVLGLAHALIRSGNPPAWRRDLVTLVLASCFGVWLARAIRIDPFATWNGLYVAAALFVLNAIASLPRFQQLGPDAADEAIAEDTPAHPLGNKGWSYFTAGLAMAAMAGISAFVPGFLGDFAWVDPNPMLPGVPRSVYERPWAPWDTVAIISTGIFIAALLLKHLLDKPGRALLWSAILFAGFAAAWLASWSTATIPLFIWSVIGIPCYFGSVASLLLFFVRWFKPPRADAWRRGERAVVGGMTRRAWLVSIPFIGSSAAGLMFRDIFNWSMAIVPLMVAIPVVAGGAILSVMGILHAARGRLLPLAAMPFRSTGPAGKRRVNAAITAFLVLGGLYAASYASYHAPYEGKLVGLYAWGGRIGDWAPDVEAKVTHALVFSLDLNLTTGVVSNVSTNWGPANNTAYTTRGIKVMPSIFMSWEPLYQMLKNTGGILDTFITTLAATLVATGVDGVSIDFEMLVNPPGLPKVTNEDWIVAWERISAEVCHAGGSDFILGVYWQISSQYTRDQVNRYFRAVDIHVENMYETHRHEGNQGSTTVIETSINNIIETYSLLDDKTMMAKVMPGLPVYHYIWIDGEKVSLNESLILPGGSWWPFHSYATLEQVIIANDATFRWDPFSGATCARFTMTLQDNRTVTVVAYLHDNAHLARTMHVMEGYGITGMMLWPAHQPVPPGFIETFYS